MCPRMFTYACLVLVALANTGRTEDPTTMLAESQMVAYQARDCKDLGNHYLKITSIINTTPDSTVFMEAKYTYEYLYLKESDMEWLRIDKTFERIASELAEGTTADLEVECTIDQQRRGNKYYRMHRDGWVGMFKEQWRNRCKLTEPLDWPFTTLVGIKGQSEGIFPFDQRDCVFAVEKDKKLDTVWIGKKRNGCSVTKVLLQEGVPTDFQIRVYPHEVGDEVPEVNKGKLISHITSKWTRKDDNLLPTQIDGVMNEGGFVLSFSNTFQWAFDNAIPKDILGYVEVRKPVGE